MIRDEFTDLDVSRQRRWQMRKVKAGLCIICGKVAVTKIYCRKHADYSSRYQRLRQYYAKVFSK